MKGYKVFLIWLGTLFVGTLCLSPIVRENETLGLMLLVSALLSLPYVFIMWGLNLYVRSRSFETMRIVKLNIGFYLVISGVTILAGAWSELDTGMFKEFLLVGTVYFFIGALFWAYRLYVLLLNNQIEK